MYSIPKEGAGQIVIIGPANSGKSSLLNALTNAKAKVAPYPFTTQIPQPAMMRYENILIQLVDTPPLTEDSPPWLKGILKAADGLLAIFDLSKNNLVEETKVSSSPFAGARVVEEIKEFKEILNNWGLLDKKILFLGNKIDLPEAKENFEKLKLEYKIKSISIQRKIETEELKKEIFDLLEIVRIYSKKPGKEPDFNQPFIAKRKTKLIELASEISQDLASSFKYAKLFTPFRDKSLTGFKKDSKKPKIVGKDYLLKDQDIIEIHIN